MKPADSLLASLGVFCILLAIIGDIFRPMSLAVRGFLAVLGVAAIAVAVAHRLPKNLPVSSRPCLPMVLLLAGLGFMVGIGLRGIGNGRPGWSRFGWDFSVILRARQFSPQPESRFPLLPGAILVAMVLATIPLINGDCPSFIDKHVLLFAGFLACGASTGAWLLSALAFEQNSDAQRMEDIEQFLSDAAAPVPSRVPGVSDPPMWLKAWNRLNVGLFFGLMTSIVLMLVGIGSQR